MVCCYLDAMQWIVFLFVLCTFFMNRFLLKKKYNNSIELMINIYVFLLGWAAETVIYRIFYYVNRGGNGRLTLRELKRGNLIAAMLHADEEEDINKVLRYNRFYNSTFIIISL